MRLYQKELPAPGAPLLIGFDVEWTKNYQRKHANRAFCFSLVSVQAGEINRNMDDLERNLAFGFVLGYAESEEECQQLCWEANGALSPLLSSSNVVVGHQFSSDLSILLACSQERLPAVETLQRAWRTRHQNLEGREIGVFDTRYDLSTSKEAASNKLVNVCPAWNLIVTQPEIKGSMTKMQKEFYQKQTPLILEKIAVLNLRHSLSSLLLYLFHRYGRPTNLVNSNTILYRNVAAQFAYVRSQSFAALLSESSREVASDHTVSQAPVLSL